MTRNSKALRDEDVERLSAYLDGWLPKEEASRLEARLETDKDLSRALHELRHTAGLLRSVPQVKPPRSFALTPQMVGKPTRSWQYPVLQLGTAVATLAFLVVTGFGLLLMVGGMAGAPAMAPAADVAEYAAPPAEQPMLDAARQAALPSEAAAAEAPPPGALFVGEIPSAPSETVAAGAATSAPSCAECAAPASTETPPLPLEEGTPPTTQPALEPSPCAECEPEGTAAIEAFGDQAFKAIAATATPTTGEVSEPLPEGQARSPMSWWVVLEVVLGTAAVLLAILTLRMRRRIR